MRRFALMFVITATIATAGLGVGSAPLGAAANRWPHAVVNGFSTPSGGGFWTLYSDGTVSATGATAYGDASGVNLNGPVVGGAVIPSGKGYWLVARDGGIFSYGAAHFYGSMGGRYLNRPVFSMAPTSSGKGYWLVARDGGIFSFGNAKFYGSAGSLKLSQPINGIATSATGHGYRMVARDGGIFSFGDASFYGSLPGKGLKVNDVVGMAPTPSGRGYWIARTGGEIYSFGDAKPFDDYFASMCDPVTAIFSNPKAQGFRLITRSGATIPFGTAPGGRYPIGMPEQCPLPPPPPPPPPPPNSKMSFDEYSRIRPGMSYQEVVAIVGGPGTLVDSYVVGDTYTEYLWQGDTFTYQGYVIPAFALIDFRNDQEYDKYQLGLS